MLTARPFGGYTCKSFRAAASGGLLERVFSARNHREERGTIVARNTSRKPMAAKKAAGRGRVAAVVSGSRKRSSAKVAVVAAKPKAASKKVAARVKKPARVLKAAPNKKAVVP